MAGKFRELPKSRDFEIDANSASVTIELFIWDTADEGEVELILRFNTPRFFRRLLRQNYKTQRIGPAEWFCTVVYGSQVPGTADSPTSPVQFLTNSFAWDSTGQTAHVNQSVKTISKTTALGTTSGTQANNYTLDNQRAIGISKDGVAGCDKFLPQFQWTYEQRLQFCTGFYMVTVASLVGTLNSTTFFGFEKGDVLYLGANGRYTADDGWTVSHKFLCLPTQRNIRISEKIKVPEKRGHDFLWVGYSPKPVGQAILQLPDAAYVEQVYEDGHFWLLGIGGVSERDALRAIQDGRPNDDGKGVPIRKPRRPIVGRVPSNFRIDHDDKGKPIINDNVVPPFDGDQTLFR